ncbi:MAG: hypothetical protein ACK5LC_07285 [Coprobacillaceae bacterium]
MKNKALLKIGIVMFSVLVVCLGIYSFFSYQDNQKIDKEIKILEEEMAVIDTTLQSYIDGGYLDANSQSAIKNIRLEYTLDIEERDITEAKEKLEKYREEINTYFQTGVASTFNGIKQTFEEQILKDISNYTQEEQIEITQLKEDGLIITEKESISLEDIESLSSINTSLATWHGTAAERLAQEEQNRILQEQETERLKNENLWLEYRTNR